MLGFASTMSRPHFHRLPCHVNRTSSSACHHLHKNPPPPPPSDVPLPGEVQHAPVCLVVGTRFNVLCTPVPPCLHHRHAHHHPLRLEHIRSVHAIARAFGRNVWAPTSQWIASCLQTKGICVIRRLEAVTPRCFLRSNLSAQAIKNSCVQMSFPGSSSRSMLRLLRLLLPSCASCSSSSVRLFRSRERSASSFLLIKPPPFFTSCLLICGIFISLHPFYTPPPTHHTRSFLLATAGIVHKMPSFVR